jgi:hypothetical protein
MSYTAVQFTGKDAVLQAFQNSDCSNWSMLQNKQFLFKYEGHSAADAYSELKTLLDMISRSSNSEATYTLRTYDYGDQETTVTDKKTGKQKVKDLPKRKIYYSTDFDGSFNFKIFDHDGSPRSEREQSTYQLKAEFEEMKKMLAQLLKDREDDEQDEKQSGIAGMLNGLLDHPQVKDAIAGKVVQLFGGLTNKLGSYLGGPGLPARVAGPVPALDPLPAEPIQPKPQPQQVPIQLPADQVAKLNDALTTLVQIDGNFADHLFKLSQIAKTNPGTYQSLIDMLNKM